MKFHIFDKDNALVEASSPNNRLIGVLLIAVGVLMLVVGFICLVAFLVALQYGALPAVIGVFIFSGVLLFLGYCAIKHNEFLEVDRKAGKATHRKHYMGLIKYVKNEWNLDQIVGADAQVLEDHYGDDVGSYSTLILKFKTGEMKDVISHGGRKSPDNVAHYFNRFIKGEDAAVGTYED